MRLFFSYMGKTVFLSYSVLLSPQYFLKQNVTVENLLKVIFDADKETVVVYLPYQQEVSGDENVNTPVVRNVQQFTPASGSTDNEYDSVDRISKQLERQAERSTSSNVMGIAMADSPPVSPTNIEFHNMIIDDSIMDDNSDMPASTAELALNQLCTPTSANASHDDIPLEFYTGVSRHELSSAYERCSVNSIELKAGKAGGKNSHQQPLYRVAFSIAEDVLDEYTSKKSQKAKLDAQQQLFE